MQVMVYSYTQIKCEKCGQMTEIIPGKHNTEDIFKLKCGCDKPEPTRKRSTNGKQTKKDS